MTPQSPPGRLDRILGRGGIFVLVLIVGGLGLAKAIHFYGELLHGWDAQFYYAAGRSLAVNGEFDVTDDLVLTRYQKPFEPLGLPRNPDGRVRNVFPVGLSLFEAGLITLARPVRTAGEDIWGAFPDPVGYSRLEVHAVAAGLLLIFAAGMQVAYGLLRTLAPPAWAAFVLFVGWLGTPLFFYSVLFPFMAHALTVVVMLLLIVAARAVHRHCRPNTSLVAFGFLTGLLYLVRPHEALFPILLMACVAWRVVRRPVATWLPGALIGVAAVLVALLIQTMIHSENIGHLRPIAHGENGHPAISGHFQWHYPRLGVVLFDPLRGLFWVTPLVALSLAAYARFPRVIPFWGWAGLVNAVIQTYLLASWSDPLGGMGFGIRPWVDHFPTIACGLAVLHRASRTERAVWLLAILLCLGWTLLFLATSMRFPLPDSSTHADVAAVLLRFPR